MEDNKPQGEDQSKEAKKVDEKYQRGLKTLTALMGGPDWAKATKLSKEEMPEILRRIVQKKKEALMVNFEQSYERIVERKKHLDRTISDKQKELEKIITEEKKAFNKEVDTLRTLFSQIDQIEKEYFNDLVRGEPGDLEPHIEESPKE